MKIIEAINKIDNLKPNGYSQSDKIEWLSILDGVIKRTVIDNYEDTDDYPFTPYTDDTPLDTELLVHDPYDEIYQYWLEAKIDYLNGEFLRYNNSILRYNDTFNEYKNDYNRNHMPKGTSIKYY